MKKNFPDEGFETEWIRCDKSEIHFDLHRCIYNDLTKEYELLNKYLNFSLDEIIKINLETIIHTFLSEKEKQELTSLYLDKIRIK